MFGSTGDTSDIMQHITPAEAKKARTHSDWSRLHRRAKYRSTLNKKMGPYTKADNTGNNYGSVSGIVPGGGGY